MKKLLLTIIALYLFIAAGAQTATNFTCNDCSGVSHDLFTELDNGNVVVLYWAMPCGACIPGGLTCTNVTASYGSNVKFYMMDDVANTVCSSLSSWAASNSIVPDAIFSNASIDMLHYGTAGMPKVVVLGGIAHTVFYNANNNINPTLLQNAIDQAILVAGVNEQNNAFSALNVFPSPVKDMATIKYSINKSSDVSVELYTLQGEKLHSISTRSSNGENSVEVNFEKFAAGMYLVRLTDGTNSQYTNVAVSH